MTTARLLRPARAFTALLLIALGAATGTAVLPAASARAATADDWATSLHDVARDGASADAVISTTTAPDLGKLWSYQTGGPLAAQPAITGGVAYVGSWDGYEYAFDVSSGQVLWKTYLGVTNGDADCNPQSAGVSSAATVTGGTVYVGGGDDYWYALDAATGAVQWRVFTGDSSAAGGNYNWSSPLIVGDYAYIGVASLGDCPLVQGKLLKVSLASHQVTDSLSLVPDGSIGGGIWTSPAYSPALNEIFTVTGTETSAAETYAQAVIGIDADTLTVKDFWHLPESEAVADSDWTTSTGLYTGSNGVPMFVATNKNGVTYAFKQADIAAGPAWQHPTAIGNDCAACGFSTVSSAAISGDVVYQAGGVATIGGVTYSGSVQAVNATTGQVLWQHPEAGPVIGAISYANGMVIAGAGGALEVLDAATGHRLYSYDTNPTAWMYAAPAIAGGVIITGNTAGTLYAFGLPASLPGPPPADPGCAAGYTCQSIGAATASDSAASGMWTVDVQGAGMSGAADQFRLISQPSAGDTQVSARLTALSGGASGGAAAGVVLRQDNSPGSPFYALMATPTSIVAEYRKVPGAPAVVAATITSPALPVFLEIQRHGDVLTAATSPDGTTFTQLPGATATVVLPYASLAGLAASSGSGSGATATAVADGVQAGAPDDSFAPFPSGAGCGAGWNCVDVGDPALPGQQGWNGGTLTLAGAGAGLGNGGMTDQFHYDYQSASGDFTVSEHITGQSGTNPGALAGLMARAGTGPADAFYGAFLTPGDGIEVMERTGTGIPITVLATADAGTPVSLRIARSSGTFTTYTSTDGVNWMPVIGSADTIAAIPDTATTGTMASSADPSTLDTVTADTISISASAPAAPTTCPPAWLCADVGDPIPPGSTYRVNDQWDLLGGGTDIWGSNDEFRYTAQQLAGDGTVSAQVISQQDTDPWAKAGLMLRAGTSHDAPYFAIFTTGGNGTVIQYRTTAGGNTSQVSGVAAGAPIYMRVTRAGTTYTAYTSADGNTWTAFPGGSVTIAALSETIDAGMAATSHSQFITGTTVFSDFTITSAVATLPFPWSDQDVGAPALAGSAGYANGVFTVSGSGADIWNTAGQFNYVSQSLAGDFSVTVRVTSQTNTDQWAKAGILIRQSADSGSSYALLSVSPGHGVAFQHGNNSSVSGGGYTFPDAWLRLTRSGAALTAYTSADGATWTTVGTATMGFTDPVMAGLAVVSHDPAALSTATFDNVTAGPLASSLPTPWSHSDVGSPAVPGSAGYAGGVFTVTGAGADIWSSTRQFHLVSQPLSGDFAITARVTSQADTDPWAKAGIIIGQSLTGAGPYALLAATPGHGIAFQYNGNSSASGGDYAFPNAWLRLTRSGTTITAYASADGTAWATVGTATIGFADPVLVGLAVCSHAAAALSTADFDNVTITVPAPGVTPAQLQGPLPQAPILAPA